MGRLARYEVMLERGFYRALHELERVQATRAGLAVPPPITVDVTGSERIVGDGNESG